MEQMSQAIRIVTELTELKSRTGSQKISEKSQARRPCYDELVEVMQCLKSQTECQLQYKKLLHCLQQNETPVNEDDRL